MKNLVKQLNYQFNKLACCDFNNNGIRNRGNFVFHTHENMVNTILQIVPYQKLVVISSSFSKGLISLMDNLNKKGTESILLIENFNNNIEKISLLFNLPEDIRGVLVLDENSFLSAGYFSKTRQIPLIINLNKIIPYELFNKNIYVNNGGMIDVIHAENNVHIILGDSKNLYKSAVINYNEIVFSTLYYIVQCLTENMEIDKSYLDFFVNKYNMTMGNADNREILIENYFLIRYYIYLNLNKDLSGVIDMIINVSGNNNPEKLISLQCAYISLLKEIAYKSTDIKEKFYIDMEKNNILSQIERLSKLFNLNMGWLSEQQNKNIHLKKTEININYIAEQPFFKQIIKMSKGLMALIDDHNSYSHYNLKKDIETLKLMGIFPLGTNLFSINN